MTPLTRGAAALALAALALSAPVTSAQAAGTGPLRAVGIENQYADVIAQVGGAHVQVEAIEIDPNTDPHSFEASPKIARALAGADLVVLNGLGYDDWAEKMLAAAANPARQDINVQHLLKLGDDTPNPHLWYDPGTMPAVAHAVAEALAAKDPAHAAEFRANAKVFDAALDRWRQAIAAFRSAYPGTPVAVTEPVANYLVAALGAKVMTPAALELAAMNDTDPAPQDVAAQEELFADKAVKVFLYNRQVTDDLTRSFLDMAKRHGIPVVGVYETMPQPGFTYQRWMEATTAAITAAVAQGTSTERLVPGQ